MEKLDTNITDSGRAVAILCNMEQQQERLDTNIIESGRSVAILNTAESVPEAKRGRRERIHWTEDEHVLFLKGLNKYGCGHWKDISKEFVVTKTPIQIASHAQKYFIHLNATEKEKRRKSIFDTVPVEPQIEISPLVTPTVEEHETPPQGMQQRETQQTEIPPAIEEIHPVLCLLYPIGSIIPDTKKLEKMRNLLAKELTQQSEN
uniref:MYB family transcription factor n=1 Tax=Melilotus albus TaxID=47082 RepID=A0A896WB44_MELAB|nr:MYB family transcription factor [Melilotus albus]